MVQLCVQPFQDGQCSLFSLVRALPISPFRYLFLYMQMANAAYHGLVVPLNYGHCIIDHSFIQLTFVCVCPLDVRYYAELS